MASRFPDIAVAYVVGDFSRPLALGSGQLDGIVMANSLHFVRDQAAALQRLAGYLRPRGRLILVEYDADKGNHWVPFPIASARWPALAAGAGLAGTRILHRVPSRFLGSIYSAVSERM